MIRMLRKSGMLTGRSRVGIQKNRVKTIVLLMWLFAFCHTVVGQTRVLSGTVSNVTGERMEGVTVTLKGTTIATKTDAEGSFQIQVSDTQVGVLVFSNLGYRIQEIEVSATSSDMLDVVLELEKGSLEEVVVVGYGVQKRANLTGAVATIGGEELQRTPANNLSNVIGGRLPGVTAVNNNGRPGSGSSIRVRGYSTLNDNNPLYVVDGIVRSDGFSHIDPNEVESITVLKDASAAAVYGARAANGVILVTTKRGRLGNPMFHTMRLQGFNSPLNTRN